MKFVWSIKKWKSWKGYKMIAETWRLSRGRGLFHYSKMEKKHATIHTETAQLNKKGNCQRSDQGARTLWMKWKKLWMSGQSLSVSQIWLLCVSGFKEATIKEGQHEVTQFTRRHMTLHFNSLSQEKSSLFGTIEIKLNLFKQNHVQGFLVFWNCPNI